MAHAIRARRRACLALAAAALGIATLAGSLALAAQRGREATTPYRLDPVYYSYNAARLALRVRAEGRVPVALDEARRDPRHPLRTLPLILLAPSALSSPRGHLVTALPALGAFLFLLGLAVHARTACLATALGAMAWFGALPGLHDAGRGLGVYLLDWPAALLGGCAAACLLLAHAGRGSGWLVACGAFAGLAALARSVATAFVALVCAPALIAALRARVRVGESALRSLAPFAAGAGVAFALAGPFLAAHYAANVAYYRTFGYDLGHGHLAAALAFARSVARNALWNEGLVPEAGLAAAALAASALVSWPRPWTRGLRSAAPLVGMTLAPGALLFALQATNVGHASVYALPPLVLLLAAPAISHAPPGDRARRLRVALGVLAVALSAAGVARATLHHAHHAPAAPDATKRFDQALGAALLAQGERVVWNALYAETSWSASMEAFHASGGRALPLVAGQRFFNRHLTGWRGHFPGMGPEAICAALLREAEGELDVALALGDPAQAERLAFDNEVSRHLARCLADGLARSPRFRRAFTLRDTPYGALTGYRNLRPDPDAYARALRR